MRAYKLGDQVTKVMTLRAESTYPDGRVTTYSEGKPDGVVFLEENEEISFVRTMRLVWPGNDDVYWEMVSMQPLVSDLPPKGGPYR